LFALPVLRLNEHERENLAIDLPQKAAHGRSSTDDDARGAAAVDRGDQLACGIVIGLVRGV